MSLKLHATRTLAAAAFAILAGFAAPAFAGLEHPQDAGAVDAVHLDMALVKKIAGVNHELKDVPESVQDEIEEARELQKDDRGVLRSPPVAILLPKLERYPEFNAALARQGLTGRQFLLGLYAIVNGGFAAAFSKPGVEPSAAEFAKWGVNPAHYRFCRDHAAEIKRLLPND